MGKIKIMLLVITALAMIMMGVQAAYEANVEMAGQIGIPKPLGYHKEENIYKFNFLGKAFTAEYPEAEINLVITEWKGETGQRALLLVNESKKLWQRGIEEVKEWVEELREFFAEKLAMFQ